MITPMGSTPYRGEEDGESDDLGIILDSLMLEEESGRTSIHRLMLRIRDVVNYPFDRLRQEAYEDHIEGLTDCEGFRVSGKIKTLY